MVMLTPIGDEGEHKCDGCDVIYMVVFHRNAVYDRAEYCPFCGEEIEGYEPEE